jgi:molybdopterin-synthase adenylyltransferase
MLKGAGRYSRQELFAGIGTLGQERIRKARVLVVGGGALGSSLAETLTRAGVGALTLVDRDYVEVSNLQRQSLFTEADARDGRPKAVAAEARLRSINSDVSVRGVVADLNSGNAASFIEGHDLVLDGTDNFETRFLVNDVCVRTRTPWIYGACVGSYGLVLSVRPGTTPCLRCLLEELPAPGSTATCDTAGVIAPIVQVVAGLQGAEALKILSGREEALVSGYVLVDVWSGDFTVVDLTGRTPSCPACTEGRFEYEEAVVAGTVSLCGRGAMHVRPSHPTEVDLASLAERLKAVGPVAANEYLVRAGDPDNEIAVFRDGRAIIKGARSEAHARSLYARYVGM